MMPLQVPTYDNFQVTPTVPQGRVGLAISQEMVTAPGQELKRTAKTAGRVGQVLSEEYDKQAKEAHKLRINDAINQTKDLEMRLKHDRESGFANIHGVDALQRESGRPLALEYDEKYQEGANEIAKSLGTDLQRQEYSQKVEAMRQGFRGQIMEHENREYQSYSLSVHQATVKTATEEISLNYRNPKLVEQNSKAIGEAAYDAAKMQGMSKVYADMKAKGAKSSAHLSAINSALQDNDAAFANKYLKTNARSMEANDILTADKAITERLDVAVATETADAVMYVAEGDIRSSNVARAYKVGNDGLPKEVDRGIFDTNLKKFKGNLPQTYAAMKMPAEEVEKAVGEAEREGVDWLSKIGKRARDHVEKSMTAYSAGEGATRPPTLLELQDQVREKLGVGSPRQLKLALDEVENRHASLLKAIQQEKDAAVAEAMQGVIDNQGYYSALPADIQNNIPPEEVQRVMDFAKRVAKGDDSTNLQVYNKLASHPDRLRELSDDQFMTLQKDLSSVDFKHFADMRAKVLSGEAKNSPQDLDNASIKRILDDRLRMLQIDPTPKDEAEGSRIGAVRKVVDKSISNAQINSGKKFNELEVQQHIDRMFAYTSMRDQFFGDTEGVALGMSASEIPDTDYDQIVSVLEERGISDPTEGQILGMYWTKLMRK